MKPSLQLILFYFFLPIALAAQNLLPSQSWTAGTGPIGMFTPQNGNVGENIRELGLNPYGAQAILWKAAPDGSYNGDGGWDSQMITIDNTKLYRLAIWIKKTGSNDGTTYFGSGSSTGSLLTLAGVSDANPYFWYGDLPELNKWYLLVGYIHPHNDPSTTNYGGIYDGVTGAKVNSTNDYKFHPSLTTARHRTYLYYDYTTSDRQYFYGPEFYQMSDNTPLVETSGSPYFSGNAFFGSRVGIGTTSPSAQLEVKGNYNGQSHVVINSMSSTNTGGPELQFAFNNTAKGFAWYVPYSDALGFGRGNPNNSLFVVSSGNVGVGTMAPDQKLTVKGKIHAEEVIINLSVPAPDYVFDKSYDLKSLEELKKFIDENKHLPEVPSAKEMEKEGVKVGEMEMILLKKVEELTLYMIQTRKELSDLKKENKDLKQSIKDLNAQ
jgi:hypothetical protein